MARVSVGDDRGAVYVEFLLAFFPIFLMFLAICQLALIGAAETVVRHSAFSAVRSAIVVLEDNPEKFDGAPRGSLSQGRPSVVKGAEEVLGKLGFAAEAVAEAATKLPQEGARMVPIQTAALLPLLPVAPRADLPSDTVANSLVSATVQQLPFALKYTRAATRISLHDEPSNVSLASEPFEPKANVTVRVSYLYQCTVPVVRVLMCRGTGVDKLKQLVGNEGRFKLLTAEATLPNQGADYYARGESQ